MKNFLRKLENNITPTPDEMELLVESVGNLYTSLQELKSNIYLLHQSPPNPKIQTAVTARCESIKLILRRDFQIVDDIEKQPTKDNLNTTKTPEQLLEKTVFEIFSKLDNNQFFTGGLNEIPMIDVTNDNSLIIKKIIKDIIEQNLQNKECINLRTRAYHHITISDLEKLVNQILNLLKSDKTFDHWRVKDIIAGNLTYPKI